MKKRSALQNISNERQKPIQLCLFSEFISNNDGDMSNIVELWEGIPKYFLNDKQQTKLRTDTGHADPYSFEYVYADSKQGDIKRSVIIQPALIKQENESYKAFFPSMTEELVEESIKKIFTYQNSGFHDTEKIETWVRFSLRMIYRELKDRGRERNLAQIKQAIDIMTGCIITVQEGNKTVYKGPILADLIPVDRKTYLDDSEAQWAARLPVILSYAINTLQFRQFNLGRLLECAEQLSRYILKRMIVRFRQAGHGTNYHFSFESLKSSGLLMSRPSECRAKVIRALNELVKKNIIFENYEISEEKTGKKITNIIYVVIPTPSFIIEQKAANKRDKNNLEHANKESITLS